MLMLSCHGTIQPDMALPKSTMESPSITKLAASARWLESHSCKVKLCLQTQPQQARMLQAASLQQLAPYLHKVQLQASPAGLFQAQSDYTRAPYSQVTDAHWAVFTTAAADLESFCVADPESTSVTAQSAVTSHMNDICRMTKLTCLHLHSRSHGADWQLLRRLTSPEDLALQSYGPLAQCSAVLISNSHCLRSLILTAGTWNSSTYRALLGLTALQTVTLRVGAINHQDAQVVANLPVPDEIKILLKQCNHVTSATLESLTSGSAQITEMALWDVSGHHTKPLQSMQYLHTLFLVRCCSHTFKISELRWQPMLTNLNIVRCWTIDEAAIFHILVRFPKLKALGFHHELGAVPANGVAPAKISEHGVMLLTQLRELSYIGLGGLHGLTRPMVKLLDTLFKHFQRAKLAKDPVFVLLPSLSSRIEQGGSVKIFADLACPRLQLVAGDFPGKSAVLGVGDGLQPDLFNENWPLLTWYDTAAWWPARLLRQ